MSKSDIFLLSALDQFEGKRNCVFTLFIPPETHIAKHLKAIGSAVSRIKNEYKKDQLLKVYEKLDSKVLNCYNKKRSKNGLIVCCGLGKDDKIIYHSLSPTILVAKYEYFYDYEFHMNGIRKYFFDNMVILDEKGKKVLVRDIENKIMSDSAVFNNKINECLDMNVLDYIVSFTTETIPLNMLIKSKSNNSRIIIFSDYFKKYHNKNKDGFIVPDTKYIGIMKYNLKGEDMNF
jgi:hypothetical protein